MFVTGDQARDVGCAALDPPPVRRENGDPGSLARHDMHGIVNAFSVVLCEFVVAAKVIGGSLFRHRYSLQPIVALLAAFSTGLPELSTMLPCSDRDAAREIPFRHKAAKIPTYRLTIMY